MEKCVLFYACFECCLMVEPKRLVFCMFFITFSTIFLPLKETKGNSFWGRFWWIYGLENLMFCIILMPRAIPRAIPRPRPRSICVQKVCKIHTFCTYFHDFHRKSIIFIQKVCFFMLRASLAGLPPWPVTLVIAVIFVVRSWNSLPLVLLLAVISCY